MMNTTNLLIAFMLFMAFLLAGCSPKEASVFEALEDAQAGDLME